MSGYLGTFPAAEFERLEARLHAVSRRPRTRESLTPGSATAQGVVGTSPTADTAGTSGAADYAYARAADIHTAGAASTLRTARTSAAALADGQGSLPGQTTLDSAG